MGAGAVGGHRVSPEDSQLFSSASPSSSSSSAIPATHRETVSLGGGNPGSGLHVQNSEARLPKAGSTSVNRMPNKIVSCETCDNNFGFFKRKKICKDCHRSFCSTCLPKPPSNLRQNGRQCDKCNILTSGRFTRQQLLAWRVKDMRCFLDVRNIPTSTCKEKHDLIDLLLLHFCLESTSVLREQREHDRLVGELADRMRSSSFYSPSTSLPHQVPQEESPSMADVEEEAPDAVNVPQSTHNSTSPGSSSGAHQPQEVRTEESQASPANSRAPTDSQPQGTEEGSSRRVFMTEELRERQRREMRETEHRLREELDQDEPETRPGIQRASIDDLQTADEADKLTVRQLKEILANNFVDYRGCCEKRELVDRVKRLWGEAQANKQRVSAALETENNSSPATHSAEAGPEATVGVKGLDPEHDVCKICMDAAIDCILLECGHMITCSKCGKRLADCPICRQYITRVVHVFRS